MVRSHQKKKRKNQIQNEQEENECKDRLFGGTPVNIPYLLFDV